MSGTIDFTRSLPPVPEGLGSTLAAALQAVAHQDLEAIGRATLPLGREADRVAAAAWLAPRFGSAIDPDRIVIANGTQSAVLLLLRSFVTPGKRLGAEALSYGMLKSLAEMAAIPVEALPLDREGLEPGALERACATGALGAIYCNPTFHNPTGTVMSEARRSEIAGIARRHGVPIIEDDPIGLLYSGIARPIAALAPDCTWYISAMTKTIAQGMRVAHLVCPSSQAAASFVAPYARLSNWVAAPLMAAAATWLIESGEGIILRGRIAEENLAREVAARAILPETSSAPGSPHVWLPLAAAITQPLTAMLDADGVLVRDHQMFRVNDTGPVPSGIRLSLSSPIARDSVIDGLHRVSNCLSKLPWRLPDAELAVGSF